MRNLGVVAGVTFVKKFSNLGCLSVYCEFALFSLVNKEAEMGNSQAEWSQKENPEIQREKGQTLTGRGQQPLGKQDVTSHKLHGKI